MADDEIIAVDGIEEVCADLARAPGVVCGVGVLNGLRAAAGVIEREIDIRTRIRDVRVGGDAAYPALITDLQSKFEMDSDNRGGTVEVGFFRQSYVAVFLEYGHEMVGHGESEEARASLGNVKPYPFMRPAADACAEEALDAFVKAVDDALQDFASEAAA
jgi:hypothetical protein